MGKPWFIATMKGYGSMPNTWQGLAVTAAYLLSLLAVRPVLRWAFGRTVTSAVLYPMVLLALTIAFMFFARMKTDKTKPPL